LEKYDKFSKIPSSHDLCQNEISWVHLYVRFRVTKEVPNNLVRIKETSLNLKFNPYNIQYTNQTCKDFTQASEIHSELLFKHYSLCCEGTVEHCSSYSDMRDVTALPPNRNLVPRFGRSSGSNKNSEQSHVPSLWQDEVWMARSEEVLAFPSCFFFRVVAPL
jgi:hypothetical protein